ncbi:MAG: DedA family protein, partial [Rikenellaceae bacterium]
MEWLVEWGYVGLFIASFISATVLPLSSEVFLVALLTRSGVDPYIAIGAATMGSWLGGLTTYYVGYLGNWVWIERWLRVSHERLIAQQSKVRRWGALLA